MISFDFNWQKDTDYFDCLKYALKIMNKTHRDRLPPNIYFFKVNNRNNRKTCEVCSKLTIKTPERRH